eukprot:scaffold2281_cov167-Skeletonema_marinoi.AAC.2
MQVSHFLAYNSVRVAQYSQYSSPDPEVGCDTTTLYKNYVQVCESIGIEPYNDLKQIVTATGEQIIITGSSNEVKLSSGGCRALMNALSGKLEGATVEPFTSLKDLRIRSSNINDCGAVAVATFLRATVKVEVKQEVGSTTQPVQPAGKLQFLDLSDNNIGHQGALHLGRSLEVGMNKTLTSLILDFNAVGSEGASALCKGIATNSSLTVLSLKHCNIDSKGGDPISAMLMFKRLALTTLDLSGNCLGATGLVDLCKGLETNTSLTIFRLADNNIRQTDEDIAALEVFGQVLLKHSKLAEVDLDNNHIGSKGGQLLLPGVRENKQITTFKISELGMDAEMYKTLFRVSNTSKGTKGKKKSKKKKK